MDFEKVFNKHSLSQKPYLKGQVKLQESKTTLISALCFSYC